ncbi:hypothetical protein GC197_09470 [bacterium]|nr:hypothetical protein [bacterium]
MIAKSNGARIDVKSIRFKLMYRCSHCEKVVHGIMNRSEEIRCENCKGLIEEHDEIAHRIENTSKR